MSEIKLYEGPVKGNQKPCRYACPDCNGPARIVKTVKLKTTGGRRLKLICKDQKNCMWTGQYWEGPVPGNDWRARQEYIRIAYNQGYDDGIKKGMSLPTEEKS